MTRQDPPGDFPDDTNTGSLQTSEPVFVAVGKLRRSHGVRGEITMEVLTDFPERVRKNRVVLVGDEHLPLKVTSVRWKDQFMLLAFEGYSDCDQVNVLRNQYVFVDAHKLPALPEGDYYYHQLIGLGVETEDGIQLGELGEILETGANDVFVVRKPGTADLLLPVIDDVILTVDLGKGIITVRLQEWS